MSEPIYAQRYRLVEALEPGRALAAHRALDSAGRPVVVTVVRPADPDSFLRVMGSVAGARHLGLPAVVDAGRDGADCFVVTEEVRGKAVREIVRDGPPAMSDVALTGAEAATALAALHEAGAVHGGIDPAALVRDAAGSLKLTGAGLAAALPPPDLRIGAPADEAQYLSPEEAQGLAAGPAADVYRLGLVLYLLATGVPAIGGPDAAVVAREHIDGVLQPPQLRNPEVPPELAQIILSALHKDPQRRPTAAVLRDRLEALLGAATFVDRLPEEPRSRAPLWIGLAVVLVLAALVAAWAAGLFGDDDAAATVAVPNVVGMTTDGARAALEQAGLTTGTVTEDASDDVPAGAVIEQAPAAGGEVVEGTAVDLRVSSGAAAPGAVVVPGVVGVDRDTASQTLLAAGFVVVVRESASDTVPAGTVMEQRPSGGVMAAAGSTVDIVVSTGPATTPAPSPTPSPSL